MHVYMWEECYHSELSQMPKPFHMENETHNFYLGTSPTYLMKTGPCPGMASSMATTAVALWCSIPSLKSFLSKPSFLPIPFNTSLNFLRYLYWSWRRLWVRCDLGWNRHHSLINWKCLAKVNNFPVQIWISSTSTLWETPLEKVFLMFREAGRFLYLPGLGWWRHCAWVSNKRSIRKARERD